MNVTPKSVQDIQSKRLREESEKSEAERLEREKKARRVSNYNAEHPLAQHKGLKELAKKMEAENV